MTPRTPTTELISAGDDIMEMWRTGRLTYHSAHHGDPGVDAAINRLRTALSNAKDETFTLIPADTLDAARNRRDIADAVTNWLPADKKENQ